MNEDLKEKAARLREKLHKEAEAGGYHLNPDRQMTLSLCEGLLTNLERYGYMGCPCRLMADNKETDLDVICPCDYRDPDLNDFGACYCALYVSEQVLRGEKLVQSIPERRPQPTESAKPSPKPTKDTSQKDIEVWRCKVCGYLCARENPPERCPICKVTRERFEPFPLPAG